MRNCLMRTYTKFCGNQSPDKFMVKRIPLLKLFKEEKCQNHIIHRERITSYCGNAIVLQNKVMILAVLDGLVQNPLFNWGRITIAGCIAELSQSKQQN